MEFKQKQYNGRYEVSGIDIYNEGELFKGVLYCPPELYKKPYPLILYFHGFPQLFTLQEIMRTHEYLLEMGYALIAFNFRGYQFSDGQISITSQVSDGIRLVEFVRLMIKKDLFDKSNINIVAHDFGAYIALILCSKIEIVNKLLLVSPVLDLKRHINGEGFLKTLNYINCFLPGNIKGTENVEKFVEKTKKELSKKEFQIENAVKKLKSKKIKIIGGEKDKITPITEIDKTFKNANITPEFIVIQGMDHECVENEEVEKKNNEIKKFFEMQ